MLGAVHYAKQGRKPPPWRSLQLITEHPLSALNGARGAVVAGKPSAYGHDASEVEGLVVLPSERLGLCYDCVDLTG
jgi:hypothetical protein